MARKQLIRLVDTLNDHGISAVVCRTFFCGEGELSDKIF